MSNPKVYSYESAFALYLDGNPLEDIAVSLGIPFDTLKQRSWVHGWAAIAKRYTEVAKNSFVLPTLARSAQQLEANRSANQKQAERLRAILDKTLLALETGAALPTPKNFRDICAAAATIHDLTYRALGDVPAKKDAGQPDRPAQAAIHVHLPPAIAAPRHASRTITIGAKADTPDEAGPVDAADSAKPVEVVKAADAPHSEQK